MNINSTHRSSSSEHRSGGRGGQASNETIQHRVMKSVSDYNRQLNQERKDDRRVCMDLQTYTIQYPVGLGRENKGLRRWIRKRRRISPLWRHGRRYPVALLPNQYQDWFLQYTPQELKYFPLNTVLHGPIANDYDKLPLLQLSTNNNTNTNNNNNNNNGNNSDSDIDGSDVLSDLDDDSTCSCGEIHCSPARDMDGEDQERLMVDAKTQNNNHTDQNNVDNNVVSISSSFNVVIGGGDLPNQPTTSIESANGNVNDDLIINMNQPIDHQDDLSRIQSNLCKICKQPIVDLANALCCADCGVVSHPSCLEIGGELLQAIRLYRWQCQDCKSCNQCGHPHDEEKMMFCDKCDRGYHTYCVGLQQIPQGHWVCSLCAICANCGTKNPIVNNDDNTVVGGGTTGGGVGDLNDPQKQWQHELIKIHSPDGQTMIRHSVFCATCYQLRKL